MSQLISKIYAIFLQDVLQTKRRVFLRPKKYLLRHEALAEGEVELETWQMADSYGTNSFQEMHRGNLYPNGVVGWFIPKKLLGKG